MNNQPILPEGPGKSRQTEHDVRSERPRASDPVQVWALEYERDETRRQKKFRLSIWGFIALLIFALLFAIIFGARSLLPFLQKQ